MHSVTVKMTRFSEKNCVAHKIHVSFMFHVTIELHTVAVTFIGLEQNFEFCRHILIKFST